ncbi:MAG: hypothetical protein NTW99_02735 [Chloroflexi bacterium]|nr:hypothetical protein [Chloroflexota bacterium]MDP2993648.1 hypothetical protein [Anaerolineales bacterium]
MANSGWPMAVISAARLLPYRILENMIDGLVITFMDITVSKKLEMELRTKN